MNQLPARPALRFYGSKWNMADWIISYMPPHNSYVEPQCGGLGVFLRKQKVKLETINDLNGRVVNYFRILRDFPNQLIRAVALTPWAEEEHELCKHISEDAVEDARRFHVLCWMSMRGGPFTSGMRIQKSVAGRGNAIATDLQKHDLPTVSQRLQGVQILRKDALTVIEKFAGEEDTLIYLDPPYFEENRGAKSAYREFETNEKQHIDWGNELLKHPNGMFMISGYNNDLYRNLYEDNGWQRHDKLARTNSGNQKIESLWLSPEIVKRLHQPNLL